MTRSQTGPGGTEQPDGPIELLWGRANPAMSGWYDAVDSWSKAWAGLFLRAWPLVAAAEGDPAGAPVGEPVREPAPPFRTHPAGKTIAELAVGDSASITQVITQADIDAFARLSGDDNPAHVDAEWAASSRLGARVAHGMFTGSLISAVLGTKLPGPGSIYMSQTLRWVAPVYAGDELTATATVAEIQADKGRVVLDTVVTRDGDPVLTGQALVMPPPAPAPKRRSAKPANGRATRRKA